MEPEDDVIRVLCPDCPDGQIWTSKGPTGELCPTCSGTAYVWVTARSTRDREGDKHGT